MQYRRYIPEDDNIRFLFFNNMFLVPSGNQINPVV
jgi:hypothetical protein